MSHAMGSSSMTGGDDATGTAAQFQQEAAAAFAHHQASSMPSTALAAAFADFMQQQQQHIGNGVGVGLAMHPSYHGTDNAAAVHGGLLSGSDGHPHHTFQNAGSMSLAMHNAASTSSSSASSSASLVASSSPTNNNGQNNTSENGGASGNNANSNGNNVGGDGSNQSSASPTNHMSGSHNEDGCVLFVGDLSRSIREEDLLQLFHPYGTLVSIDLKRDKITGTNLGYAFVTYSERQEAQRAKKALNGIELPGAVGSQPGSVGVGGAAPTRKIKVGWASKNTTLFIGDLDGSITSKDLIKVFEPFGMLVHEETFVKEPSRKYGFVRFVHRGDAEQAKAIMTNKILGTRPIRIGWGDSNFEKHCVHIQFDASASAVGTGLNVNQLFTEQFFAETFQRFANEAGTKIETISLPRHNHNKKLKGFAFIHFTEDEAGEKAALMALQTLTGAGTNSSNGNGGGGGGGGVNVHHLQQSFGHHAAHLAAIQSSLGDEPNNNTQLHLLAGIPCKYSFGKRQIFSRHRRATEYAAMANAAAAAAAAAAAVGQHGNIQALHHNLLLLQGLQGTAGLPPHLLGLGLGGGGHHPHPTHGHGRRGGHHGRQGRFGAHHHQHQHAGPNGGRHVHAHGHGNVNGGLMMAAQTQTGAQQGLYNQPFVPFLQLQQQAQSPRVAAGLANQSQSLHGGASRYHTNPQLPNMSTVPTGSYVPDTQQHSTQGQQQTQSLHSPSSASSSSSSSTQHGSVNSPSSSAAAATTSSASPSAAAAWQMFQNLAAQQNQSQQQQQQQTPPSYALNGGAANVSGGTNGVNGGSGAFFNSGDLNSAASTPLVGGMEPSAAAAAAASNLNLNLASVANAFFSNPHAHPHAAHPHHAHAPPHHPHAAHHHLFYSNNAASVAAATQLANSNFSPPQLAHASPLSPALGALSPNYGPHTAAATPSMAALMSEMGQLALGQQHHQHQMMAAQTQSQMQQHQQQQHQSQEQSGGQQTSSSASQSNAGGQQDQDQGASGQYYQ